MQSHNFVFNAIFGRNGTILTRFLSIDPHQEARECRGSPRMELRWFLHRTSSRWRLRHLPPPSRRIPRSIQTRWQHPRPLRVLERRRCPKQVQLPSRLRQVDGGSQGSNPMVRSRARVHPLRWSRSTIRMAKRRFPRSTRPILLWCWYRKGLLQRYRWGSLPCLLVRRYQDFRYQRWGSSIPMGVPSWPMWGYRE